MVKILERLDLEQVSEPADSELSYLWMDTTLVKPEQIIFNLLKSFKLNF